MLFFDTPFLSSFLLSFGTVFLAEFGDKSQLVCVALAAKNRSKPVFAGAALAFALLNLLAVLIGSTLAAWIDQQVLLLIAAILFFAFGISSLKKAKADQESVSLQGTKSLLASTFMLIFIAELGDKTQLTVAALSSINSPVAVYIGATLGLLATTAIGIYIGSRWLARVSQRTIHHASAALFILIGILATLKLLFA